VAAELMVLSIPEIELCSPLALNCPPPMLEL
jgi:hypothetical protein